MSKEIKVFSIVSTIITAIVVLILIVYFFTRATQGYITLGDNSLQNVSRLLGSLFVISLFLERSLEVFVTPWRANESERLQLEISIMEEKGVKTPLTPEEENTLANNKSKLQVHKQKSRTLIFMLSLACGIAISIAGFKLLSACGGKAITENLGIEQHNLLKFLDILITGGLIAGGSDVLHKVYTVFDTFMTHSKKKIKQSANA